MFYSIRYIQKMLSGMSWSRTQTYQSASENQCHFFTPLRLVLFEILLVFYVLAWESATCTSKHFCFTFIVVNWGIVLHCLYLHPALEPLLLQVLSLLFAFYLYTVYIYSIFTNNSFTDKEFVPFVFLIDTSRCFMFHFQVWILIKFFKNNASLYYCFLCQFNDFTNTCSYTNLYLIF